MRIIMALGVLLFGHAALAQTFSGPTLWAHRFPGQSAPSLYGYGTPPGRGPMLRYSTSPMDMALAEAVTNLAQPLLGGTSSPYSHESASDPDPYLGAFGASPGWSAPFDVNPVVRPSTAAMPSAGVFMP